MPVAETAPPKVEKAVQKKLETVEKVLVFSIYPEITLSVEKIIRTGLTDADGRAIKRGRQRQVQFQKHMALIEMKDMNDKFIMVDDGMGGKEKVVTQVGVRGMEGYGRDFFECIRTPGIDEKVLPFVEMIDKNPNQAESLIAQAKQRNLYANMQGLSALTLQKKCIQFQLAWNKAHGIEEEL